MKDLTLSAESLIDATLPSFYLAVSQASHVSQAAATIPSSEGPIAMRTRQGIRKLAGESEWGESRETYDHLVVERNSLTSSERLPLKSRENMAGHSASAFCIASQKDLMSGSLLNQTVISRNDPNLASLSSTCHNQAASFVKNNRDDEILKLLQNLTVSVSENKHEINERLLENRREMREMSAAVLENRREMHEMSEGLLENQHEMREIAAEMHKVTKNLYTEMQERCQTVSDNVEKKLNEVNRGIKLHVENVESTLTKRVTILDEQTTESLKRLDAHVSEESTKVIKQCQDSLEIVRYEILQDQQRITSLLVERLEALESARTQTAEPHSASPVLAMFSSSLTPTLHSKHLPRPSPKHMQSSDWTNFSFGKELADDQRGCNVLTRECTEIFSTLLHIWGLLDPRRILTNLDTKHST
jgi:hypothetical protein